MIDNGLNQNTVRRKYDRCRWTAQPPLLRSILVLKTTGPEMCDMFASHFNLTVFDCRCDDMLCHRRPLTRWRCINSFIHAVRADVAGKERIWIVWRRRREPNVWQSRWWIRLFDERIENLSFLTYRFAYMEIRESGMSRCRLIINLNK